MARLTDTQLVVLSAALQRPRSVLLPLPGRLKGGAAQKVVQKLLAGGLVAEVPAAPGEPVWREDGEGRLTLVATGAAAEALGVEPDGAPERATVALSQEPGENRRNAEPPASAAPGRTPRAGTKQARLVAMLEAEGGATLDEIVAATGWQAHTVRGAIAGALKKRLGLTVASERVEGRGRVYRIVG